MIQPKADSPERKIAEEEQKTLLPNHPDDRKKRRSQNFCQWTAPFWVTLIIGILAILLVLAVLGLGVALHSQSGCDTPLFRGNYSTDEY